MPLRGLTELIDVEWIFAMLAASGGIARIVTGTTPRCHKSTVWGETCRIFFVAMPIGIMFAMYMATVCEARIVWFASAFTAGTISLNVVRFLVSKEGFDGMKSLLITIISGGKK